MRGFGGTGGGTSGSARGLAAATWLLLLPLLGGADGRVAAGGGCTGCSCTCGGMMPLEETEAGPAIEEEAVELEQVLERSAQAVAGEGRSEKRSDGRGMLVAHDVGGVL